MNLRKDIINEGIKALEEDGILKINAVEFMKTLTKIENFNRYYLIIASKVFKERNWILRRESKGLRKQYYEFQGRKENNEWLWV